MKWRGRRTSGNIEDRRGSGGGGGFRGLPMGGGGMKIGGLGAVVVVVIALFLGVDPTQFLGGGGGSPPPATEPNTVGDAQEEFVAVVLADTEEVWTAIFAQQGATYQRPKLVLFSGSTNTACGLGETASGPFYCPADQKAYLDLDFFRVLESQLGARGDFARAYVIAHEVAHHVQNLLGIMKPGRRSNEESVRIELQADCLSGVWAKQAERRFGTLEPGDIEEALNAASQIGDDTLQRRASGRVVPDSFTHGSSAQRVRWFRAGYDSGRIDACDTFNASRL